MDEESLYGFECLKSVIKTFHEKIIFFGMAFHRAVKSRLSIMLSELSRFGVENFRTFPLHISTLSIDKDAKKPFRLSLSRITIKRWPR
jgi:hypothetical protein